MRIPIELDGFEDHEVVVETAGMFSNARLLIDGQRAPRGKKRNTYILSSPFGFRNIVELQQRPFDPIPRMIIDGRVIELPGSLSSIQMIWSGLPIVLVIFGGLIGGGLGAIAFWINVRVFRTEMSTVEQYLLSGLISIITGLIWLILGTVITTAIGGLI